MKKEKILVVADYFYPHWTGIAKSMYYFVNAVNTQYDITVLTVQHSKDLLREEKLFGVQIIRVSATFSISRAKYSFAMIKKICIYYIEV